MTSRDEALRALEKKYRDISRYTRRVPFRLGHTAIRCHTEFAKEMADDLSAILATASEQAPVAWPPRAMRGDDGVTLSAGYESLPLMSGCDMCRSDEAGTWNRCLDECQRATAKHSGLGIGAKDAQELARWLEIHYRGNFTIPEIRQIHEALLGVYSSPAHTSDARDAGVAWFDAARARFFADGPEGHFYADSAETANAMIRQMRYDRDEWTVTDLQNPTGDAAMRQEAGDV